MRPSSLTLLAAALLPAVAAGNTVVFIEQSFHNASDPALARIANVTAAHGGTAFGALSMMTWTSAYSPTEADPLPEPDAGAVAFLHTLPSTVRLWGGVSLCPGPAYACMLNYTQSAITGQQLAARVVAANLDGVMIYVSPYCNNANCKKTTGKYAVGIAAIISAYRAAAPNRSIALLANEWDHMEIIAGAKPDAIFSYQTIFYFTSVSDCKADAGALCGAGEGSSYVTKAGKNWTSILEDLDADGIHFVGQMAGATTPDAENPEDLWTGLEWYMGRGTGSGSSSSSSSSPSAPTPFTFLALGDWGGSGTAPFYQPGELATAEILGHVAGATDAAWVLALGDNFYPMGLCNNGTLAPYNSTCPARMDPRAGTADDTRFNTTFESVFVHPGLATTPWIVMAGNHDALGNVSASIAYAASGKSRRWTHPNFYYRVTTSASAAEGEPASPSLSSSTAPSAPVVRIPRAVPGGVAVDVLVIDVTICYGIWSDPVHTAMCNEQLAWLEAELKSSTAGFLFVAGHYPLWSACAHGNTDWALQALLPLLTAYNATGYFSGHDHCGEFIAPNDTATGGHDLVEILTGTGDGCCYGEPNVNGVPPGSLKFLLSAAYNPTNATGGFAAMEVALLPSSEQPALVTTYVSANGTVLYTAPALLPRVPILGPGGAIVGMASPDYAAAGLPRPSDVAPAAQYAPTGMRGWRGTLKDHEEDAVVTAPHSDLLLPADVLRADAILDDAAAKAAASFSSSSLSSSNGREVTIWLYAPTASNDTWAGWYEDLAAHRANVTGVAPCSYEMAGDGSFITQFPNASAAATARYWTQRMGSAGLGLATLPLLAASGTGMNIAIANATVGNAFIQATLAEALALGLSGYNIQLEEPGSPTIEAEWTAFLSTWLAAFAPHNLTISIIIGGVCRGRDWMYMDCGNYRTINATNLRIIPEATYEQEPSNWKSFFADLLKGLGPGLLTPGLEYGPPLLNPGNGCLPAAAAAGVTSLYVWVNTPDGTTADAAWAAFGWWLNSTGTSQLLLG